MKCPNKWCDFVKDLFLNKIDSIVIGLISLNTFF